jgi:uncharacterized integral membrane protein
MQSIETRDNTGGRYDRPDCDGTGGIVMTEGRRSPADPRDGEPGTSVERPAEVRQQPPPGAVQPMPRGRRLKATRASAVWVALVVGVLVLVAILIFVAQNSGKVNIHFLMLDGTMPLGVALLVAAILGALLMFAIGTVRILQLRRLARRPEPGERRQRA